MLSASKYGWTRVSCGTADIGPASYLTDVPGDCLDAFIGYFGGQTEQNFCMEFDAEGYSVGILEFGNSLYQVSTATEDGSLDVREISPSRMGLPEYTLPGRMLKTLAAELVSDIRGNLDGWVYWLDGPDTLETEDAAKRRAELEGKCRQLEKLIRGSETGPGNEN